MIIKTNSAKETEKVAKSFVEEVARAERARRNNQNALIVGLYGELGSGKTTFVKGIAKAFGFKKMVTSPTFVIEKIYALKDKNFERLIHIDAYRLKSGKELLRLGWEEISKNSKNIIFIEWPENIKNILTKNKQKIYFRFIDENTREIEINYT